MGLLCGCLDFKRKCGKQSRVSVNPFELVERADTRGKDRILRRALSDAESARLLQVAGKNQLAYMLPLFAGLAVIFISSSGAATTL